MSNTKTKMVDINKLKTIQNFAVEYGKQSRGEAFSTQYIYKLLKQKAEGHPRKLHFQLVNIDGIQFIQQLKYTK
jgi:5,10-methylenetetrahydrofolate reductase